MNSEDLKEAVVSRRPVIVRTAIYGEIEYAFVQGIIYRATSEGKIYVQAEVMDKSLHSVSIVNPKSIYFKEERK